MSEGISDVMWSRKSNEWITPQWLYDLLNKEFEFELDPAATDDNARCDEYYTIEEDGLQCPWAPSTTYVNPPYSPWQTALKWVKKAYTESQLGAVVVMLLPVRTSNIWFHKYVMKSAEIRFMNGRLVFANSPPEGWGAPFPSMIVVFRPGNYWPIIGPTINARNRSSSE